MTLTKDTKAHAHALGARLVAVAPVDRWNDPPPFDADAVRVYPHTGYRPDELLPSARSVIVVALRYLDGLMEHLTTPARTTSVQNNFGYIHLNRRLHQLTFSLAEWLEDRGYASLPLGYNIGTRYAAATEADPTAKSRAHGLFSMKRAAVLAGLGRATRSGLVATPEFGPRVRLGAVLTAAPLDGDPLLAGDPCPRGCDVCSTVCPTDAVSEEGGIDHLRCHSDVGRQGKTYTALHESFKQRYPPDAPGADVIAHDTFAIDGSGPRHCKIACMVYCPIGAHRLPDVWRRARDFTTMVPKVQLDGFPSPTRSA